MGFHEVLRIKRGDERLVLSLVLQWLCFFRDAEAGLCVDVSQRFTSFWEALPEITLQARVCGGTPIPDEWFPSPKAPKGSSMLVPSTKFVPELPKWNVSIDKGYCAYSGQSNAFYSALEEYLQFMLNDHANHPKVGRELWMTFDYCILNNDIGGAIDCIRLLSLFPEGSPVIENIMQEAMASKYLPLNLAVADQFEFHPVQKGKFIEKLTWLALDIPYLSQITRIIKGFRILGGESSFDALMSIALNSGDDETRIRASKALAWVKNLDDIEQRLKKLVFSKDRKTKKIASMALSTLRNHSIYSDGAPFATKKEKDLW